MSIQRKLTLARWVVIACTFGLLVTEVFGDGDNY